MPPSAARKTPHVAKPLGRARRAAEPIVIYVGSTLDGTSFALDPISQQRIREAFPGVQVSSRHMFIGHETREAIDQTVRRFENQVVGVLAGVSPERLAERFPWISFRDPKSEREVGRLRVA